MLFVLELCGKIKNISEEERPLHGPTPDARRRRWPKPSGRHRRLQQGIQESLEQFFVKAETVKSLAALQLLL